ncbi:hypothetical protein ACFU9B_39570 [Streptomyces sp. NPDC057592]|uniref:hypothetical protein n=1 Tax=unclassified Streptomyces TaxID=2593676 RepID=UPI00369338E6
MNLFDNPVANGSFGTIAFGAIALVLIIAGFKFNVLRDKKTVFLVALAVLAVTVNSAGLLGGGAGAMRVGMNIAGEQAIEGLAGAQSPANPPTTHVTPVNAFGALLGICILVWFLVKSYAANWRPKDWREMAGGTLIGISAGSGVGFLGIALNSAVLISNNVGFWVFGG